MAKGDSKTARNMINTEQNRVNTQSNQLNTQIGGFTNQLQQERGDALNRSTGERENLYGSLNALNKNPVDPTVASNLRALNEYGKSYFNPATGQVESSSSGGSSGGDSGGGGAVGSPPVAKKGTFADVMDLWKGGVDSGFVDVGKLESAIPGFQKFAESGGFDPERMKSINDSVGGLKKIGETGGIDASTRAGISGSINKLKGFGDTGGFDPAQLDAVRRDISGVREIGETGGFDPNALGDLRDTVSKLKSFGDTGGLDAEAIARSRGAGVFDEFARTGGYSDRDVANMRARATSGIPALYARENEKLNRMAAVQGGYAPGATAARARMIRGTGQALTDATRDAELGIQDAVRKGRQWGGEKLSGAELSLQDLMQKGKLGGLGAAGELGLGLESELAANKLAGRQGAARLGSDLEASIAGNRIGATQNAMTGETELGRIESQNKLSGLKAAGDLDLSTETAKTGNMLSGLKGITDTYGQSQGLLQKGRLGSMEGLTSTTKMQADEDFRNAQAAQAAAAASAAQSAANSAASEADRRWWAQFMAGNERYLGELGQSGQTAALGGLGSLYGTGSGEMDQYNRAIMGGYQTQQGGIGQQGQLNQGLINQQLNLANQPGMFDKIIQGAGAIGGVMSGFGGFNPKQPTPPPTTYRA